MSRFENWITRRDLYRIAKAFADVFIATYKRPPKAILLDIDDTEDKVYGSQQLSLFNAYFNGYCYQPLHIYEGQTGKLITTVLRPGRRPTGAGMANAFAGFFGVATSSEPTTACDIARMQDWQHTRSNTLEKSTLINTYPCLLCPSIS